MGNSSNRISTFYGLNRTRKGIRGEMEAMVNMSADEYPCTSPSGKGEIVVQTDAVIDAVCAPDRTNADTVDGLTGVSDGGFYYNGVLKSGSFKLPSDYSWSVVRMGNMYIINGYVADHKRSVLYYYNIDTNTFGNGGVVMSDLIVTSGKNSSGNFLAAIDTDSHGVYDYTLTLSDGRVIENKKFFKAYADKNNELSTTDNIFAEYFKVGDEVTIEGFPSKSTNEGQIWNHSASYGVTPQTSLSAEYNNTLDTDNMATTDKVDKWTVCSAYVKKFDIRNGVHYVYFDLYNKNGDEVDFDDLMSGSSLGKMYCSGVTLSKRRRAFDNITTHHGRLWGTAPSGNVIYASASDDIFSFSAEDVVKKYGARINSDTPGLFTGMSSFNNELILFKEDSISVVSGTGPTNYSISAVMGIGCISPKSIVTTPRGIIFLSYNGFYMYTGAVPGCISLKLNTLYTKAVSGYDGDCYYASAETSDGKKELLVYDMRYGAWYVREPLDAVGFFRLGSDFYMADTRRIYKCSRRDFAEDWSFTLLPDYDEKLNNKGVNEIWIRAQIYDGASFRVETSVSGEEFRVHSVFDTPGIRLYRCPVRMEMGENVRVRISGKGRVVIYEIEMKNASGGRRYKELI